MKIINNRPEKLGQLKDGDVFKKGEYIYMKIYSSDEYKAIRLDTGDTYKFNADSEIILLDSAELIIN